MQAAAESQRVGGECATCAVEAPELWSADRQQGWSFHRRKRHRAVGFLFAPDGQFFRDEALFDYFCPGGFLPTLEAFTARLERANGFFAVLLDDGTRQLAAVDRLRSIPLFWTLREGSAFFSPDGSLLAGNEPLDPFASLVFRRTAHSAEAGTLWPSVSQIPAGCGLAKAENQPPRLFRWFDHHRTGGMADVNEIELFSLLDSAADRLTDRMTTLADGAPIAVSLSGGLDSRLVLGLLLKAGYPSVVAFSYGLSRSPDARTAHKVASLAGIPWHFVDYARLDFNAWFDDDAQRYQRYAFRGASLPFEQDYFALRQLSGPDGLPPEALIVNGHSGDVITGKKIPPPWVLKRYAHTQEGLTQWLYDRYLAPKSSADDTATQRLLLDFAASELDQAKPIASVADWIAGHESWKTRHETAQYIINSVRAYEHFGWRWHMPLYDSEWLRFWQDVPDYLRQNQQLYKRWLNERLFGPLGLDVSQGGFDAKIGANNSLRRLTPAPLRRALKRLLPSAQADPNGLRQLTSRLHGELSPANAISQEAGFNRVYAAWYIEQIQQS